MGGGLGRVEDYSGGCESGFLVIFFLILITTAIVIIFKILLNLSDKRENERQAKKNAKATAEQLGEDGENKIANILHWTPSPRKILRNLYIPKENGETTEIDLVLINKSGIFVIESKNYKGWIFGTVAQKLWTVKYLGGETRQLFNPIWQNRLHVKFLKEQLPEISEDLFYSIIVFGSESEIKTQIGDLEPNEEIISVTELFDCIKSKKNFFSPNLNKKEIEAIAEILELNFCNRSEDTKQKHINDIENKTTQIENSCIICGKRTIADKLCAECKKKLTDNGFIIDTSLKCILCGADSGSAEICENCKKKLSQNDITLIKK